MLVGGKYCLLQQGGIGRLYRAALRLAGKVLWEISCVGLVARGKTIEWWIVGGKNS